MACDAAGAVVDELAADIGGEVGDALQVAGEADAGDVVFHGSGAVEDGGVVVVILYTLSSGESAPKEVSVMGEFSGEGSSARASVCFTTLPMASYS